MTMAASNGRWPEVFFLLENRRAPACQAAAFLFERPVHRITARSAAALGAALDAIEKESARGHYVCGYLAYEAGAAPTGARPRADVANDAAGTLIDFFSFEQRQCLDRDQVTAWLSPSGARAEPTAIYDVQRSESKATYRAKIETIKEYIRAGDTYQVNFTFKYRFGFEGSARSLYRTLRDRQRVEFGAFIRLPECEILSFSPELFVRRDGDWLTSKPMKGTAPRGRSTEEDQRLIAAMRADPKTLSENVMIVDLLRSDLGTLAEVGSVTADNLFEVQTFETVHQMVSTIRAKVGADAHLRDILSSLFPCGSITGAPKRRTMEIIRELEAEPRGIYTGAIGFVAPSGGFCFSVPIRTLVIQGQRGEMGVGSGIVDESDVERELEECVLKAGFFTGINASFRLIESMRFDADTGTIHRQDAHIERAPLGGPQRTPDRERLVLSPPQDNGKAPLRRRVSLVARAGRLRCRLPE